MIKPLSWAFVLMALSYTPQLKASGWLEAIDARLFSPSPQQQSYNEGVSLFQAGKPDEALGKFQIAAVGEDRGLKAKALHNAAVIQIAKQELEPARDLLKQANSFDNDNQAIKENLAWVEEQLKDAEKKPNEKQADDQKTAQDEEKSAEEKSAEEKSAEEKSAEEKSAEEKSAEEKSAEEKDSKQADNAAKEGDKKDAEAKDSESKQASQENKDGEEKSEDKDGEDALKKSEEKIAQENEAQKKASKPDDKSQSGEKDEQKSVSLDPKEGGEAGQDQEQLKILTPAEIKQQEAERLLRNIDDKIGRYPLTDTEATDRRGKDGKNW